MTFFDPGDFSWGHGSGESPGSGGGTTALLIPFDPGDFGWGAEGEAEPVAFALKIGELLVPIIEGGHDARDEPRATEVRRGARGNALSSITSVRGHRRRWSITTPPLSASDAVALEAVLATGLPLSCTGVAVDGSVTAYCPPDTITADADEAFRFSVSFELVES